MWVKIWISRLPPLIFYVFIAFSQEPTGSVHEGVLCYLLIDEKMSAKTTKNNNFKVKKSISKIHFEINCRFMPPVILVCRHSPSALVHKMNNDKPLLNIALWRLFVQFWTRKIYQYYFNCTTVFHISTILSSHYSEFWYK